MRQLVYTMFISNNRASFHLWWKKNLVKHKKVSEYYENDCSIANLVQEFPHELPNDLRLRILGNKEILGKSQVWVET